MFFFVKCRHFEDGFHRFNYENEAVALLFTATSHFTSLVDYRDHFDLVGEEPNCKDFFRF